LKNRSLGVLRNSQKIVELSEERDLATLQGKLIAHSSKAKHAAEAIKGKYLGNGTFGPTGGAPPNALPSKHDRSESLYVVEGAFRVINMGALDFLNKQKEAFARSLASLFDVKIKAVTLRGVDIVANDDTDFDGKPRHQSDLRFSVVAADEVSALAMVSVIKDVNPGEAMVQNQFLTSLKNRGLNIVSVAVQGKPTYKKSTATPEDQSNIRKELAAATGASDADMDEATSAVLGDKIPKDPVERRRKEQALLKQEQQEQELDAAAQQQSADQFLLKAKADEAAAEQAASSSIEVLNEMQTSASNSTDTQQAELNAATDEAKANAALQESKQYNLDNTIAMKIGDDRNVQLEKEVTDRKAAEARLAKAKLAASSKKPAASASEPVQVDAEEALQRALRGEDPERGGAHNDTSGRRIQLVSQHPDKLKDELTRQADELEHAQARADNATKVAEQVNEAAIHAQAEVQTRSRELIAMTGVNVSQAPRATRGTGATGIEGQLATELATPGATGPDDLDRAASKAAADALGAAGMADAINKTAQEELEQAKNMPAKELQVLRKENDKIKADNEALRALQAEAAAIAAGSKRAMNDTNKGFALDQVERMLKTPGHRSSATGTGPGATGTARGDQEEVWATGPSAATGANDLGRNRDGSRKTPRSMSGHSLVFPSRATGPTGGATGATGATGLATGATGSAADFVADEEQAAREAQAKRLQDMLNNAMGVKNVSQARAAVKELHVANTALKEENARLKKQMRDSKVQTVADAEATLAKAAGLEKSIQTAAGKTSEAVDVMKTKTDQVIQDVDRTFAAAGSKKPVVAKPNSPECDSCLAKFKANSGCTHLKGGAASHTQLLAAIPAGCAACSDQAPKYCGIDVTA
jgi:hypothetical protein